jgi:hypothetical protein
MNQNSDAGVEFEYPFDDEYIRDIINLRSHAMTIAALLRGPMLQSMPSGQDEALAFLRLRFRQLEDLSGMVETYLLEGLSDLQKARLVPKPKDSSPDQDPR